MVQAENWANMQNVTPLIVVALGALLLAPAATAHAETCFADWSAASTIAKAESLVPIDQLAKLAPSKLGGDVVRSSLCETNTGFVYKLVVRDKAGELKTLTVDAKQPFDR